MFPPETPFFLLVSKNYRLLTPRFKGVTLIAIAAKDIKGPQGVGAAEDGKGREFFDLFKVSL